MIGLVLLSAVVSVALAGGSVPKANVIVGEYGDVSAAGTNVWVSFKHNFTVVPIVVCRPPVTTNNFNIPVSTRMSNASLSGFYVRLTTPEAHSATVTFEYIYI